MVNPLLPLLELKARHARRCRRIMDRAEGGTPQETAPQRRSRSRRKRGRRRITPLGGSAPPPPPAPLLHSPAFVEMMGPDSLISPRSAAPSALFIAQMHERGNHISLERIRHKPLHLLGATVLPNLRVGGASVSSPRKPGTFSDLPPPGILSQPGVHAMILGATKSKGVTLETMTELLRRDFSPVLIKSLTGIFQRADCNHTKSLDREEMLSFMTSLYNETTTPLPPKEDLVHEIEDAFLKFDKDTNDVLDLVEIVSFLRVCHLSIAMNKKWRPKVSAEALALKKQMEEERIRRLKEENQLRRRLKELRNQRLRDIVETTYLQENARRIIIEEDELWSSQLIFAEHDESVCRGVIERAFLEARIKIFYTYAVANRRAIIACFGRETELIKRSIVSESLKLVNSALRTALKEGTVNKGVESLFSTVGYKCSLNRLVKDLQESAEEGRQEEIDQYLDGFLDKDEAAFSGDRWKLKEESCSPREIEALAIRLQEYYHEKYPDNLNMLGEITENLGATLVDVVHLASTMYRRHRKTYPNNSPSALLVMCLYTCEPKHIEKLLRLPKDTAPAIYADINRALRNGHKSSNHDAQDTLKRWIGFIAVLATTKVNSNNQYQGRPLYRGLMNLSQSVKLEYLEKEPGEDIYWASATSASLDRGLVTNEFTKEGTALLFVLDGWQEGAEMWHVSAYFEEKEMLLPPFTVFSVARIDMGTSTIFTKVRGCLGDGNPDSTGFCEQVDRDFSLWLKRVISDKSHEAMATQILAVAALRQEVEKLPKVFLSEYSKLLIDEQHAFNVLVNNMHTVVTTLFVPCFEAQQHIQIIWKHVNNSAYLTKITKYDFGGLEDFAEIIDEAVQSLVG